MAHECNGTSAFQQPKRKSHFVVAPPRKHTLPYVTGGLKFVWKLIKDRTKRSSYDVNYYTDEKGHFWPEEHMPLLADRYRYMAVVGTGQSSVLLEAQDTFCDDNAVAIKVLHEGHVDLGPQEYDCIRRLNMADPWDCSATLRLKNTFMFGGHYCLVFESLCPLPLKDYFNDTNNNKQHLGQMRKVCGSLLKALGFLRRENVIHADLKPENILLADEDNLSSLKVVDFGNAIRCVHDEVSLYYSDFELQTLLYRAPEVMFGLPFGLEIDMWSLGCILAELYFGQPIFYGNCKADILKEVVELMGPFPVNIFQRGKFYSELQRFTGKNQKPEGEIVQDLMKRMIRETGSQDYYFAELLVKLLRYDPSERLKPEQAAQHMFLASESSRYLMPLRENGSTDTYPTVWISPQVYTHQPYIKADVKWRHLSSADLLRQGTGAAAQDVKEKKVGVAQVIPIRRLSTPSPENTEENSGPNPHTVPRARQIRTSVDIEPNSRITRGPANSINPQAEKQNQNQNQNQNHSHVVDLRSHFRRWRTSSVESTQPNISDLMQQIKREQQVMENGDAVSVKSTVNHNNYNNNNNNGFHQGNNDESVRVLPQVPHVQVAHVKQNIPHYRIHEKTTAAQTMPNNSSAISHMIKKEEETDEHVVSLPANYPKIGGKAFADRSVINQDIKTEREVDIRDKDTSLKCDQIILKEFHRKQEAEDVLILTPGQRQEKRPEKPTDACDSTGQQTRDLAKIVRSLNPDYNQNGTIGRSDDDLHLKTSQQHIDGASMVALAGDIGKTDSFVENNSPLLKMEKIQPKTLNSNGQQPKRPHIKYVKYATEESADFVSDSDGSVSDDNDDCGWEEEKEEEIFSPVIPAITCRTPIRSSLKPVHKELTPQQCLKDLQANGDLRERHERNFKFLSGERSRLIQANNSVMNGFAEEGSSSIDNEDGSRISSEDSTPEKLINTLNTTYQVISDASSDVSSDSVKASLHSESDQSQTFPDASLNSTTNQSDAVLHSLYNQSDVLIHPLSNQSDVRVHPLSNQSDVLLHPLSDQSDAAIHSLPGKAHSKSSHPMKNNLSVKKPDNISPVSVQRSKAQQKKEKADAMSQPFIKYNTLNNPLPSELKNSLSGSPKVDELQLLSPVGTKTKRKVQDSHLENEQKQEKSLAFKKAGRTGQKCRKGSDFPEPKAMLGSDLRKKAMSISGRRLCGTPQRVKRSRVPAEAVEELEDRRKNAVCSSGSGRKLLGTPQRVKRSNVPAETGEEWEEGVTKKSEHLLGTGSSGRTHSNETYLKKDIYDTPKRDLSSRKVNRVLVSGSDTKKTERLRPSSASVNKECITPDGYTDQSDDQRLAEDSPYRASSQRMAKNTASNRNKHISALEAMTDESFIQNHSIPEYTIPIPKNVVRAGQISQRRTDMYAARLETSNTPVDLDIQHVPATKTTGVYDFVDSDDDQDIKVDDRFDNVDAQGTCANLRGNFHVRGTSGNSSPCHQVESDESGGEDYDNREVLGVSGARKRTHLDAVPNNPTARGSKAATACKAMGKGIESDKEVFGVSRTKKRTHLDAVPNSNPTARGSKTTTAGKAQGQDKDIVDVSRTIKRTHLDDVPNNPTARVKVKKTEKKGPVMKSKPKSRVLPSSGDISDEGEIKKQAKQMTPGRRRNRVERPSQEQRNSDVRDTSEVDGGPPVKKRKYTSQKISGNNGRSCSTEKQQQQQTPPSRQKKTKRSPATETNKVHAKSRAESSHSYTAPSSLESTPESQSSSVPQRKRGLANTARSLLDSSPESQTVTGPQRKRGVAKKTTPVRRGSAVKSPRGAKATAKRGRKSARGGARSSKATERSARGGVRSSKATERSPRGGQRSTMPRGRSPRGGQWSSRGTPRRKEADDDDEMSSGYSAGEDEEEEQGSSPVKDDVYLMEF